jgi:hypothetical protein
LAGEKFRNIELTGKFMNFPGRGQRKSHEEYGKDHTILFPMTLSYNQPGCQKCECQIPQYNTLTNPSVNFVFLIHGNDDQKRAL